MRKRIAAIIGLLACLGLLFICSFDFAGKAQAGTYVYDDAGLLSETFISQLNQEIASVREEIKADILVIFTDDEQAQDARTESEKIASSWILKGGGYGENHEIVSLYVNMADRSYFVNEHNDTEDFELSYDEIDTIKYTVEDRLRAGSYDGAALEFVQLAERKLQPGFFQRVWSWILMGLLGGGAAMGIAKGSHNNNTGVPISYYRKGNIENRLVDDVFMGTTTTVHRIEQHVPQQDFRNDDAHFTTGHGSSGNQGGGGHF